MTVEFNYTTFFSHLCVPAGGHHLEPDVAEGVEDDDWVGLQKYFYIRNIFAPLKYFCLNTHAMAGLLRGSGARVAGPPRAVELALENIFINLCKSKHTANGQCYPMIMNYNRN